MEVVDTAYNEYVLCPDCEYSLGTFVSANQEFRCPRWGTKVKNVGVCKYYSGCKHGDTRNK